MICPKFNALIYRNWERILIFLVSGRPGMERPGMGIDPTERPGIPAIPGLFGREQETMGWDLVEEHHNSVNVTEIGGFWTQFGSISPWPMSPNQGYRREFHIFKFGR